MKLFGIILIIIGVVSAIPLQIMLPIPFGLGAVVIIIVAGIFVLRKRNQKKTPSLEILKERYAKGDITKEEFDKMKDNLGLDLPVGSKHYRAFLGPPDKYDVASANQFVLLVQQGLREYHKLLDIGCGSLRTGRLFIPYLLSKNYYGIEPNEWLIDEGIKENLGQSIIDIKKPHFSNSSEFLLDEFNTTFDYILANSIFTHASQNQIRKCLMMANKVMDKKSIFVATFFMSDKNADTNSWTYPECVYYTLDFIKQLASENNLILEKLDYGHPANQTWVKITKKN